MHRSKQWQTVLIAAIVLVWFPAHSQGDPITLDATARGWHFANGTANGAAQNNNYAVGSAPIGFVEGHNWFGFDLAGVSGSVTAVTLLLTNPPGGFISVDPFEQYTIFDVTSAFASLGSASSLIYSI